MSEVRGSRPASRGAPRAAAQEAPGIKVALSKDPPGAALHTPPSLPLPFQNPLGPGLPPARPFCSWHLGLGAEAVKGVRVGRVSVRLSRRWCRHGETKARPSTGRKPRSQINHCLDWGTGLGALSSDSSVGSQAFPDYIPGLCVCFCVGTTLSSAQGFYSWLCSQGLSWQVSEKHVGCWD